MDGSEQKVVVDSSSVDFAYKKDGKPTFACRETVSTDGQTMTEEFTNTMEAATVTGRAGFTRVSKRPMGSHALSGEWRMETVRNDTRAGTLTTCQTTPGGMTFSDGSQSYEAKFNDADSPVSLKFIDEYTIEETSKRDGKVVGSKHMTVSKDASQ